MTAFVNPGPAVTRAKALRPSVCVSLKYSAATTAVNSWTTGTMAKRVRQASTRCMMLPPATNMQCV